MGTITVNIKDEDEKKFRQTVEEFYGSGKGKLGKAVSEALREWADERNQKEIAREMMSMMNKGIDMGKIKYKNRSELYDRRLHSSR